MTTSKGRFRTSLHPRALEFSSSLNVDKRLYREDIEGSLAHISMLAKCGIVATKDASAIRKALFTIRKELDGGKLPIASAVAGKGRFASEDIHMAIEALLISRIGEAGGRLHIARSRNDQVALDERLYLRGALKRISHSIRAVQRELVRMARRFEDVLFPAYTHLQRAQPSLFAHHLLAYVAMLDRDRERFSDCNARVNRSPLGAAAATGTSFPIDRGYVARLLQFDGLVENSIDAVSDRDVQIEAIAHAAITMMHLSRFAEELVLWSSREWNFISIGEGFTTGSSIMPQKKNPDVAELIRGKAGRVYGDLVALLTVMKGLPLAYNRDMQEDKEPLFDAVETAVSCCDVLALMIPTIAVNRQRFASELQSDFSLATDLADYLVARGLSFRKAHGIVGEIVSHCERKKISLAELPFEEYRRRSRLFRNDVLRIINARTSLLGKRSRGSSSPAEVRKAIAAWSRKLR